MFVTSEPSLRYEILLYLSQEILNVLKDNRTALIGIDGIDCSGKTTLARELRRLLVAKNKAVTIIEVETFLNPKSVRYSRGKYSPEAFFYDYWNYDILIQEILRPVISGKSLCFLQRKRNFHTDQLDQQVTYELPIGTIGIVDGLFLLQHKLRSFFDLVIRLHISEKQVLERALTRDVPSLGDREYVYQHYTEQVIPAHNIYMRLCNPDGQSDILIDNSNPEKPIVLKSRRMN